jgi:hypothetical protein
MAQVMERPDVVGYLRRLQRRPELVGEPLVADPCATFGMAEDEVTVSLVDGALVVVGEGVNEDRRERDGALAFFAFDSTTRRTFSTRLRSRQRSAQSSKRRMPVSMSVRNIVRACSSSNDLRTRPTSVGWRMRQRLRRTFGRSAPSAGFDSISSSAFAVLKTS